MVSLRMWVLNRDGDLGINKHAECCLMAPGSDVVCSERRGWLIASSLCARCCAGPAWSHNRRCSAVSLPWELCQASNPKIFFCPLLLSSHKWHCSSTGDMFNTDDLLEGLSSYKEPVSSRSPWRWMGFLWCTGHGFSTALGWSCIHPV